MYPWVGMLLLDLGKYCLNWIYSLSSTSVARILYVLTIFWCAGLIWLCPDDSSWLSAVCCVIITTRIIANVAFSYRVLQDPSDFPRLDVLRKIKSPVID